MNAGKLNTRVTIQKRTVTRGADGSEVEAWINGDTVWAEVKNQSGREFYTAQKINAELTHLISIRYRTDVRPTWRLKLGNRYLDILSAINVNEANRELLISCKEVVS